jgi:zinc protease
MRIHCFIATALLCTSPLALMAKPETPKIATQLIAYNEFKLTNGLRVIVHNDRKAPVVAVSVTMLAPRMSGPG